MKGWIKLAMIILYLLLCRLPVCAEEALDELSFDEIEESIDEIFDGEQAISFRELVAELIQGEIPFDLGEIGTQIAKMCFGNLEGQKQAAVQILILSVIAAVFTNYTNVFEKSQTAEVSFYLIYLVLAMILLKAFLNMEAFVLEAVDQVAAFLKALLPVYVIAAAFANGSLSAAGFSELTLAVITVLQWILKAAVLPGIHLYVMISVLNRLDQEDRFSKFPKLIRTVVVWALKTMTAAVIGLQTVQCLIMPAIDTLKTSLLRKAAGAIPGVGNVFNSVTEVVLGSAVVVKNAVGAAGMAVMAMICLLPLIQIALCAVLYRFLAAITQPVSDKRLTLCVESAADGAELLLKVVIATGLMFFVSLALVTAFMRGG